MKKKIILFLFLALVFSSFSFCQSSLKDEYDEALIKMELGNMKLIDTLMDRDEVLLSTITNKDLSTIDTMTKISMLNALVYYGKLNSFGGLATYDNYYEILNNLCRDNISYEIDDNWSEVEAWENLDELFLLYDKYPFYEDLEENLTEAIKKSIEHGRYLQSVDDYSNAEIVLDFILTQMKSTKYPSDILLKCAEYELAYTRIKLNNKDYVYELLKRDDEFIKKALNIFVYDYDLSYDFRMSVFKAIYAYAISYDDGNIEHYSNYVIRLQELYERYFHYKLEQIDAEFSIEERLRMLQIMDSKYPYFVDIKLKIADNFAQNSQYDEMNRTIQDNLVVFSLVEIYKSEIKNTISSVYIKWLESVEKVEKSEEIFKLYLDIQRATNFTSTNTVLLMSTLIGHKAYSIENYTASAQYYNLLINEVVENPNINSPNYKIIKDRYTTLEIAKIISECAIVLEMSHDQNNLNKVIETLNQVYTKLDIEKWNQGMSAFNAGNFEEAEINFTNVLNEFPYHQSAIQQLAVINSLKKDKISTNQYLSKAQMSKNEKIAVQLYFSEINRDYKQSQKLFLEYYKSLIPFKMNGKVYLALYIFFVFALFVTILYVSITYLNRVFSKPLKYSDVTRQMYLDINEMETHLHEGSYPSFIVSKLHVLNDIDDTE